MGKLIKFDHVNALGDFEKLLSHFGIDYEKTGTQLRALCPFHEDTNPSLSVTLEAQGDAKENTWHCFGCKESGSIIDFAARMLGDTLRDGAMLVADLSNCGLAPAKTGKPKKPQKARGGAKSPKAGKSPHQQKEASQAQNLEPETASEINLALKFTLPLDTEHAAVSKRVPAGAALTFGLGVCNPDSRSMMAGRLCVPVHNLKGELIAYAGRYLGDDPKEPKWLLPKGFEKQHCLYNAHRVAGARTVALVEGFFDAIRLHAIGVPAVAVIGTSLADGQLALLRQLGAVNVAVLFDGDESGRTAAAETLPVLCQQYFTRVIELPDGEDPASVDEDTLRALLAPLVL